MLFEDMVEAISWAHLAALDGISRALWAAVCEGRLNEAQAAQLSEAIDARRIAAQAMKPVAGQGFLPMTVGPARKPQRPPERSVAIERRRRLAASGPMPPALAARFTTGEMAVLRIVADEFQVRQICAICLDAIAARAGVSRTLAKGAIRQARRLGFLEVHERRRTGAKSLPNVVRVIDRDWLAWLKRGAAARQGRISRPPEGREDRGQKTDHHGHSVNSGKKQTGGTSAHAAGTAEQGLAARAQIRGLSLQRGRHARQGG